MPLVLAGRDRRAPLRVRLVIVSLRVNRAVEGISLVTDTLHDVHLAGVGPGSILVRLGKHPQRRPDAVGLAPRQVGAELDAAVQEGLEAPRDESGAGVLPAEALVARRDGKYTILDRDVGVAAGVWEEISAVRIA